MVHKSNTKIRLLKVPVKKVSTQVIVKHSKHNKTCFLICFNILNLDFSINMQKINYSDVELRILCKQAVQDTLPEKERQTDRQRDRQADRQTERQIVVFCEMSDYHFSFLFRLWLGLLVDFDSGFGLYANNCVGYTSET